MEEKGSPCVGRAEPTGHGAARAWFMEGGLGDNKISAQQEEVGNYDIFLAEQVSALTRPCEG